MITKILSTLSNCTDALPIAGGSIGALTQVNATIKAAAFLPTWEAITAMIILASVGAFVGYFIKLLLDWMFDAIKNKQKKNEIKNK